MKLIRYNFLIDCISTLKPKKIVEIGLAMGHRSYGMISIAKKFNKEIEFVGYDVFDTKDSNWHKMVGNAKKVSSKIEIQNLLLKVSNNFKLIEGMTQDTLWNRSEVGDLVFIDGDHRVESIKLDYESVKKSKLVVFDDYYPEGKFADFTTEKYGCNQIIDKFPSNEVIITPKTIQFPDIRMAIWSKDIDLINVLKKQIM